MAALLIGGCALTATKGHAATTTSCNPAVTNCKTVTVDASGALTNPTSGTITMASQTGSSSGIQANTTYQVVDAIEALPVDTTSDAFYTGTYTFSWTSCSQGSASGTSTYQVTSSAGSFSSDQPPSTTGTLPTVTTAPNGVFASNGVFSCNYTLTFSVTAPRSSGITQVRNDVFLLVNGTPLSVDGTVASANVLPPGSTTPPVVPEAPLAIGLPLAGLALLAGAFGVALRRSRNAADVV